MSDLSGYETGVAYSSQFKAETMPGHIVGALAFQGWAAPDITKPFRYLDLGCGDGLVAGLVAASHPHATVEGIDGAKEHIDLGLAFAGRPSNLTLTAATFDQCSKGEADCDFIVAQGVISWIAPHIRDQVFDIAAHGLRPGGVFAVSYNAMPGWTKRLAMQHLLQAFRPDDEDDPVEAFDAALAKVIELAKAGLVPVDKHDLASLLKLRSLAHPTYFPHEYFAAHWQPLWSSTVRRSLAERSLSYVGQAGFSRLRPELTLRKAHRAAVAEMDAGKADMMTDFFHNTPFRIDLFVKEPVARETIHDVWLLAKREASDPLIFESPAGVLKFDNPVSREVFSKLQKGPLRFADLVEQSRYNGADIGRATDCLLISRHIRPCSPPLSDTPALQSINQAIIDTARTGAPCVRALAGTYGPVAVSTRELRKIAAGGTIAGLKHKGVTISDLS